MEIDKYIQKFDEYIQELNKVFTESTRLYVNHGDLFVESEVGSINLSDLDRFLPKVGRELVLEKYFHSPHFTYRVHSTGVFNTPFWCIKEIADRTIDSIAEDVSVMIVAPTLERITIVRQSIIQVADFSNF